jgi:hypothetical protein
MFANAKVIEAPTSKKKAEAKKIAIFGVQMAATLDFAVKALTALRAVADTTVKTQGTNEYLNMGLEAKARPDNYKGVEGKATVSMEFRNRASSSACSPEELELLKKHNIPTTEVVTVIGTYVINPEYVTNLELLGKIEALLREDPTIPDDLFMLQEEVKKTVVADTAIDVAFQTLDRADLVTVFPLIAVPATKYTFDETPKVVEAMAAVNTYATTPVAAAAIAEAMAPKKKAA